MQSEELQGAGNGVHDTRGARYQAQSGVRAWVAGLAGRSDHGTMPRVLLAGLCASAIAPVAVAGLGLPMVVAGAGVVGSIGANLLTEMVGRALAAAQESGAQEGGLPRPPSVQRVERELAAQLDEVLAAGDARARELSAALAAMLGEVQAAQTVLAEAVRHGEERLVQQLARGFAEVGGQMAAFEPMLGQLETAAGQIQQTLQRQDAEHRQDRRQTQQQMMMLMLLREQVIALHRRLPPVPAVPETGPAAGGGAHERWTDGCPYQGLLPFGPGQAGVFYGRGQATMRLAGMLAARVADPGVVVVTGASGAGKSSLLQAGLLPGLARGLVAGVPAARQWPHLVMTPTERPLRELAVQLATRCGADPDAVLRELRHDPARAAGRAREVLLADAVRRAEQGGGPAAEPRRLVVVVDQLEELFTHAPDPQEETAGPAADRRERRVGGEAEREGFLAALQAIATSPAAHGEPAGVVVAAVRGDYVDRCAAYPELARALEERVFVLGPMSADELDRAITGPAAAAGVDVEDGLADQVVRELAGRSRSAPAAGVLPLLSLAMMRTWDNREHGRLTRQGYDRAGGVAFAVQATAEEAYNGLDARHQQVAKQVLLLTTSIGPDGQVARRRATHGELLAACGPACRDAVKRVIDAFTVSRLMVTGHHGAGDDVAVELAHDVLLTAWPRLQGWLAEDHADRALYSELLRDAEEWDRAGRDHSFLYRGQHLELVRHANSRWQADPGRYPALLPTATDFLQTGARAAVRARRGWQSAFAALVVMLVVAVIAAAVAVRSGREADRQRVEALSRQLAAQSEMLTGDPGTSAQLAATAWQLAPTPEARASMATLLSRPDRVILTGHNGTVSSVAFSPDGLAVASAGFDGTVRLWDTATRRPIGAPLTGHNSYVSSVAFSPDGRTLASTGDDATVRLWDVATGRPVGAPLASDTGSVYSVAFSPDGRAVAAGCGGVVRLWEVATGKPIGMPLTGHTGIVYSVAFTPDGRVLASTGDDATVRLWDIATRRPIGSPLTGHSGPLSSVAFSPDGRTLAGAGYDKTVRLWDTASRRPIGTPITGHTDRVAAVSFSPDGRTLASAGADGTVRLWDITTCQPIGTPLTSHIGPVSSVAFSPDGRTLASTGTDGTVRLWDVTTRQPIGTPLASHTGGVFSVAFSPDGRSVASGGEDKTVRLWDTASRRPIGAPLHGHNGSVSSVAFSADRRTLASAGSNKAVRLWDTASRRPIGTPLTDHNDYVSSVAFSPDGRTLASAGSSGMVRLRDTAGRQPIGLPLTGHQGPVSSVAFSPDGRTLASAGSDGTIRLWDITTQRPIGAPLISHIGSGVSVAFSPDGRILAAGCGGGVRLWEVATRRPIGTPLTGHNGPVFSVTFSPDGHTLASAGSDGTVRLWDTASRRPIGTPLTGHDSPVFSVAFSPDGRTLVSAGEDKTVRFWDVSLPSDLFTAVCAVAGQSFTPEEWNRYVPGEQFRPGCP